MSLTIECCLPHTAWIGICNSVFTNFTFITSLYGTHKTTPLVIHCRLSRLHTQNTTYPWELDCHKLMKRSSALVSALVIPLMLLIYNLPKRMRIFIFNGCRAWCFPFLSRQIVNISSFTCCRRLSHL